MSSRTWQILALAASVGILIAVVLLYHPGEDGAPVPSPSAREGNQPHVGAEHHTADEKADGSNRAAQAAGEPARGSAADPVHEGEQLVPIQAYANARVGDWYAYESIDELADGTVRKSGPMLSRVVTVTDDNVMVTKMQRPGGPADIKDVKPRHGLTVDDLAGNTPLAANTPRAWTIHGVSIADDAHEIGGRTFRCKKLAFTLYDPRRGTSGNVEMWLSDEVSAGGLVEFRQNIRGVRITLRLLGFGTATTTTWGMNPEADGSASSSPGSAAAPPRSPAPAAPR